jgi:tetratricopeptide (TPR) repeat protein
MDGIVSRPVDYADPGRRAIDWGGSAVSANRRQVCVALFVAAAVLTGCVADGEHARPPGKDRQPGAPARGTLLPITLPDLSRVERPVEAQLRTAFESVIQKQQAAATPDAELGVAYGELGKLLMSAKYYDLAESCLRNAEALAPRERQWPYYLGHVHKTTGELPEAAAAFTRALALSPDDVPSLIWLGDVHLVEGRPVAAKPLFAAALAAQPRNPAARFGLGRTALAERDYAGAITHFEEVLRISPQGSSVHYPLALAYRAQGQTAKAEAHLRLRGDSEILPADPLMDAVRELLQSPVSYEIRGTRALNAGDWYAAAREFRAGLALEPSNAPLRQKLGTALYMAGDLRSAQEVFEEVVRQSPEFAGGHYSLGVLLQSKGQSDRAIAQFSSAVAVDPGYVEARVRLAESLRADGRLHDALTHYDRALAINPRLREAALGRAMTLVRLERYVEARDRLEEAARVHPTDPWIAHALARVLAASPDGRARDGGRALAVMHTLSPEGQRLDHGESMAMALAEVGRYREAAEWQRSAMAAARQAGQPGVAKQMADVLRNYESGRPVRVPWREGELQ